MRNVLIEHYKKCVVCDIDIPELLIASHIKPWSVCSNEERLDPANALLLCPLHDKLFEKGYFTINSDYKLIISSSIPDNIIEKLGLKNLKTSFTLMKNTKNYLEYHMSNKLKK